MIAAPFFAAALVLLSVHEGQVVQADRPSIIIQETLDAELNSPASQGQSMAGVPAQLPEERLPGKSWELVRELRQPVEAFLYKVTCEDGHRAIDIHWVAVTQSMSEQAAEDVKREYQLRLKQLRLKKVQSDFVAKLIPPGFIPCDEGRKACLVMQYFSKGSLKSWMEEDTFHGDTTHRAKFFWQLTKGVKYIHDQGLVHLDIKLDSAVVHCQQVGLHSLSCDAALIGLGIAKKQGEPLETAVGTLGWQAPEVAPGAIAAGSMDVWSLGVLLQWLFTNTRPSFVPPGQPAAKELSENRGKEEPELKRFRDSGWFGPPALPARITVDKLLDQAAELLRLAAGSPEPKWVKDMMARTPEEDDAREPLPACLANAPWAPEESA